MEIQPDGFLEHAGLGWRSRSEWLSFGFGFRSRLSGALRFSSSLRCSVAMQYCDSLFRFPIAIHYSNAPTVQQYTTDRGEFSNRRIAGWRFSRTGFLERAGLGWRRRSEWLLFGFAFQRHCDFHLRCGASIVMQYCDSLFRCTNSLAIHYTDRYNI